MIIGSDQWCAVRGGLECRERLTTPSRTHTYTHTSKSCVVSTQNIVGNFYHLPLCRSIELPTPSNIPCLFLSVLVLV